MFVVAGTAGPGSTTYDDQLAADTDMRMSREGDGEHAPAEPRQ